MTEDAPTFADLLVGRRPAAVELATALRDLIRELDPAVVEVPWPGQGTIGFGIGPKKSTEHYAYLAPHAQHVNLGFNQGAELEDPTGLLGGPGDKLKHLRISALEQVRELAARALLVEARAHRAATTTSSGRPNG